MSETKYKVSLFVSPSGFPFWFAVHPWFILEHNGSVSRWEVTHVNRAGANNWGHLSLNILPPSLGIGIFHYNKNPRWPSRSIGSIEGDEGSLAQRITEFIEASKDTYPYRSRYAFSSPNSNTYVQWLLNHFSEWKVTLPWNAFGKNYK